MSYFIQKQNKSKLEEVSEGNESEQDSTYEEAAVTTLTRKEVELISKQVDDAEKLLEPKTISFNGLNFKENFPFLIKLFLVNRGKCLCDYVRTNTEIA